MTDDRSPRRPIAPAPRAAGRTGVTSAGHVLIVIVVALVLAALFNARSQYEGASQQELGTVRDVKMAIWKPLDVVADKLRFDAPRNAIDRIRYGPDESDTPEDPGIADPGPEVPPPPTSPVTAAPGGVPSPTAPPGTTGAAPPATTAAPPEDTVPIAPRILVVGDSLMLGPGEVIQAGAVDVDGGWSQLDARAATGFSRPDYFDWPAHLRELVAETNPTTVVAFYGGNDGQPFMLDGEPVEFASDAWVAEYTRRLRETIEMLAADGRTVVWLGLPAMRDAKFDGKMQVIDAAIREAGKGVDRFVYFDTSAVITPNGYTAYGPGVDGSEKQLRQSDGIHLSIQGAQVVGHAVLDELERLGLLGS